MRCNICDRPLANDEISFNNNHNSFDPCGVCLEIIDNIFEPNDDEFELIFLDDDVELEIENSS